MHPSAVLVSKPDINFDTFLALSSQVLGHSPASKADGSGLDYSEAERFVSCLAAIRDPNAPAGLNPKYLSFLHYVIYVVAETQDMIDIIEACSGMPVVSSETIRRDAMSALIAGTARDWRDAVKNGASPESQRNVRGFFCNLMKVFSAEGLDKLWRDFKVRPMNDNTFYLEDKR